MPSQIVRAQPNSNFLAGPFDHCPGGFITYGENPLVGLDVIVSDVRLESVSHLLRNEYMLTSFSTFGVLERKLPVLYISRSQFQHFSDSHPTPGHQFQDESVSWLVCPEDDFIDDVLFNNFPRGNGFCLEHFTQNWSGTWVVEIWVDVGCDEVEKS